MFGDLAADPRFALRGPPGDRASWTGDAKVSGSMVRDEPAERVGGVAEAAGVADAEEYALVRADLGRIVVTTDAAQSDRLTVATWRTGRPVGTISRERGDSRRAVARRAGRGRWENGGGKPLPASARCGPAAAPTVVDRTIRSRRRWYTVATPAGAEP